MFLSIDCERSIGDCLILSYINFRCLELEEVNSNPRDKGRMRGQEGMERPVIAPTIWKNFYGLEYQHPTHNTINKLEMSWENTLKICKYNQIKQ